MLIEFVVENFRSFKEETVFSLIATKDESHASHIVVEGKEKPLRLLRAAAFYGANASGKSNLITAIAFAREFIIRGTRAADAIPHEPYKLSAATRTAPSRFEFVFTLDDVLYTYGFKADTNRVHEEWLFATPGKKEVTYFERVTSETGEVTVEFGGAFIRQAEQRKAFFEFVALGTRPNQLFLTEAVERNVTLAKTIQDWFRQALLIVPADSTLQELTMLTHRDEFFTEFLGQFLIAAGTGVAAVETRLELLDFEKHFPELPDDIRREIIRDLSQGDAESGFISGTWAENPFGIFRNEDGQAIFIKLLMKHETEDGEIVSFDVDEESDGTRRLINLAPTLLFTQNREHVLLIDELDRRLHPLLSRLFVQSFFEGTGKGQMIFTTHETNLLDLDLLRRDEIWFIEKNRQGASHLFSLTEFKIREDLKISKGYLNGRFGAIPFIGDISRLGWTEATAPTSSTEKTDAAHFTPETTA